MPLKVDVELRSDFPVFAEIDDALPAPKSRHFSKFASFALRP